MSIKVNAQNLLNTPFRIRQDSNQDQEIKGFGLTHPEVPCRYPVWTGAQLDVHERVKFYQKTNSYVKGPLRRTFRFLLRDCKIVNTGLMKT